ncbi:Zn-finger DNA-binding domain protein [Clostridium tetanomorphum DSM 665]|nr:Zn-finger DNA-binding domain protein [Clostridium tetanomorphum DSM 665]MBP1864319.1 transposase-like protein [Clostridium tetanomorphum]NRZ96955.1 transposase-like protein [Clostridium tetanomorphum]
MLVLGSQVGQVTQEVKEFRFAKGKVCPRCNAEVQCNVAHAYTRITDLKEREPIFV